MGGPTVTTIPVASPATPSSPDTPGGIIEGQTFHRGDVERLFGRAVSVMVRDCRFLDCGEIVIPEWSFLSATSCTFSESSVRVSPSSFLMLDLASFWQETPAPPVVDIVEFVGRFVAVEYGGLVLGLDVTFMAGPDGVSIEHLEIGPKKPEVTHA
jgi:hypothetical protein